MALPGAPLRGGNLPAELTSFVGRRRELAEVKRLLNSSRLVTLTGVGGAGKTRLALRAASTVARDHPDGAWFVDLAELRDGSLLAQSITSALGLRDRRSDPPLAVLVEYLADKKLLLVLDNCDHLRDECAVLGEALLRRARDLRVLTTSRHTLGVTGEHVFHVPPLAIPEDVAALTPDAVAQYEAVHLFAARAQAVSTGFRLTESTVQATATICQRLDGIPLAIELAAARLRAMSVQELVDRLEDRFSVLVGGSPSALPRHRTLRELIGWSWDLCTEEERTVWARASVFSATFDMAAAEAVCAWQPLDEGTILEAITGLVDKSILITQEDAGRVRYRMLETIRQYGLEQLATTDQHEEVRERQRGHYTAVARDAGGDWFSERQATWLRRLRLEQSHVRAALDASLEHPELVGSGLKLISDLWFFWLATGQTSEARRWLERGLAAEPPPSTSRTRAMVMCAYLCVQQEDLATAAPLIETASSSAQREEDLPNRAWARQVRAMAVMCQGDLAAAEPLFDEALEAHRMNGDEVGVVDAIFFLAALCSLRGDHLRAEALYREAITACEGHGENWSKSYMLWGLAVVAWRKGEANNASAHARAALDIGRHLSEPWTIAFSLEVLAWTTATAGDHERAARLLGGARELWRRLGWRRAGGPLYYGLPGLTEYHDQCVSQLGEQLGADKLELAMQQGAALTLDEIVLAALDEPRARRTTRASSRVGEQPSLTKREGEVAELVSQGLSNREIAKQLFISQRTAEVHVENILMKLGFKSRAQIAAWVVERRAIRDS